MGKGVTLTQYGSLLIPIIMIKLTPELCLRFTKEWNVGNRWAVNYD